MKIQIITGDSTSASVYTDTIEPTADANSFQNTLDTQMTANSAAAATAANNTSQAVSAQSLDDIFNEAASTYQVDVNLLKAMAKQESGFHADSTSSSGAMGIMQLMPETAKNLGVTDAYDPYQNIMGGAKYIRTLLDRYNGDTSLALAAYNGGSGNVKKYGGVPPFCEKYVTNIESMAAAGVSVPDSLNSVSETATTGSTNDATAATASSGTSSEDIRQWENSLDSLVSYLQYAKPAEGSSDSVKAAYNQLVNNANTLVLRQLSANTTKDTTI